MNRRKHNKAKTLGDGKKKSPMINTPGCKCSRQVIQPAYFFFFDATW